MEIVLIAVIAGALASLLKAAQIGDRGLEGVSKTAASLGFVALGAIGPSRGDPTATWLVTGLGLCALGDVLLISDRTFEETEHP